MSRSGGQHEHPCRYYIIHYEFPEKGIRLNVILFEDERVDLLRPVTTGRASFAITCAGFRLVDLVQHFSSNMQLVVRPHLQELVRQDFPECHTVSDSTVLAINGRVAPILANLKTLKDLPVNNRIKGEFGDTLAAHLPFEKVAGLQDAGFCKAAFDSAGLAEANDQLDSIRYLHDLIRVQCDCLSENIQYRMNHIYDKNKYHEIADGVFSRVRDFSLGDSVVTDTSDGPILLEQGCIIGPFSFLKGPLWFGPNTRVAEHSSIKEAVSTGTTCKIGGEIEATIVESYSNKQHHGFWGTAI